MFYTFLAPGGVGKNIFACISLGKLAYTGSIINSASLDPSLLTRSCSIS